MSPIDKEKLERLGDGPWMKEVDRLEFGCEGFPCVLNRNEMGVWCGYVGVPSGHPWHKKHYHDLEELNEVEVHGGLTYSDHLQGALGPDCTNSDESNWLWWLGFDCGHSFDYSPGLVKLFPKLVLVSGSLAAYRDIAYARAETEFLAAQASIADRH